MNPGNDERVPDKVQSVSYGAIAPTAKLNVRRSTEALSPSSYKISIGRQLQKGKPANQTSERLIDKIEPMDYRSTLGARYTSTVVTRMATPERRVGTTKTELESLDKNDMPAWHK